jgi:hypothetical protein
VAQLSNARRTRRGSKVHGEVTHEGSSALSRGLPTDDGRSAPRADNERVDSEK